MGHSGHPTSLLATLKKKRPHYFRRILGLLQDGSHGQSLGRLFPIIFGISNVISEEIVEC